MKRYSGIVLLLFLPLIIAGCGYNYAPDNSYSITNGQKVLCGKQGDCQVPFYYVDNGITHYCYGDWSACTPVTPPAVSVSAQCTPNYAYDHLVDEGQSWVVVSKQQDTNNSTLPAQVTFTSTTSKTVTVTDKLDVIANLNVNAAGDAGVLIGVITLNVKAEIDHEVTQTVDATIGNAYTASIPPGKIAYANYGVRVQITSGHLHDKAMCKGSNSDSGTDITYVPIATGWCVWTSDQSASLCPSL